MTKQKSDWQARLMEGLDPLRYTAFTYDSAYRIMPNGDIITSDGRPRDVDNLQLQMVAEQAAKEGRTIEFRFRAPTEGERGD
jgi:hypothetical protein